MGLDMYLHAHRSVNWNKEDAPIREAVADAISYAGDVSKVSEVVINVGYWRKANHVHRWFVENVQDGADDCREYWVTRANLENLLNVCKNVAEEKERAEDLLPTESGFFFGGTDYDEWYFDDVESTITILEEALAMPDTYEFYYRASW